MLLHVDEAQLFRSSSSTYGLKEGVGKESSNVNTRMTGEAISLDTVRVIGQQMFKPKHRLNGYQFQMYEGLAAYKSLKQKFVEASSTGVRLITLSKCTQSIRYY